MRILKPTTQASPLLKASACEAHLGPHLGHGNRGGVGVERSPPTWVVNSDGSSNHHQPQLIHNPTVQFIRMGAILETYDYQGRSLFYGPLR